MLNLKLLENGGTIIGDGDIADIVDEHLIETLRTERALYDVGEGRDSLDVLSSDILTLLALSENTYLSHFRFF